MIRRYRRLNRETVLLASLAVLTVAGPALAGPFVTAWRLGRNADAIRHHL